MVSDRTAARLAWFLWAVSLAGFVAALLLGAVHELPGLGQDLAGNGALALAFAAFSTVGTSSRGVGPATSWGGCSSRSAFSLDSASSRMSMQSTHSDYWTIATLLL